MERLGNPQNSYRAIHIAGTSGKGSTAYMISGLLRAAGKTVGLHVSPHVYDLRERMQVNGKLVGAAKLCRHVNEILPVINAMSQSEYGAPTYFEVTMALAHLVLREHKVDYGVVETGIGGRYDVSNLITRQDKLAVLNQIGLDHTGLLGNSIGQIAAQKAGIIQTGNHAIALWQKEAVRTSFDKRAEQMGATLEYVKPDEVARVTDMDANGLQLDLNMRNWNWPNLTLSLTGKYQASNAALALRAVQYLSQRDRLHLSRAEVGPVLEHLQFPARFEVHRLDEKTVVLDAAHNPQKLMALAQTLAQVFPGQKVTFVLAMTYHKNCAELLAPLLPVAEQMVLTSFTTDSMHTLQPPEELALNLDRLGFADYLIEPDVDRAMRKAYLLDSNVIVATGSLYFMGNVRDNLKKVLALV